MIGIFLYSTFPFLRLEFIATIKLPSILAVQSSLGRNPVNSEIKAQKIMNTQGSMKLIGVNDSIMEVFDVTGFLDILTIE